MTKLEVIDSVPALKKLLSYIQDKNIVSYDIETTGLTTSDEVIGYSICAEESVAYYVVLAKWDVELKQLIYANYEMYHETKNILNCLKNKQLVMHNGVFDCYMTESYFKIRLIESLHTDTMILAHLLDENRKVGLKELGVSIFGEDSTKEAKEMKESVAANGGGLTKANYEMYKADWRLMGRYGAKDALLTYRLFLHLVPELFAQGLEAFFYDEESMPLLKGPTYDLNTTGLQVDLLALQSLKKQLEAECFEAKNFIYNEIANYVKDKYPGTNKKNTFNIGSSSQLSWLLFGVLKLEFGVLTKEGKTVCKALGEKLPYTYSTKQTFIDICEYSNKNEAVYYVNGKQKKVKEPWSYIACGKETLEKLQDKQIWIKKLLEYQKKLKILTTYVKGIEERTRYGVIYPSFLQHGTTSGRYSSRNPNFQNLPRDDKRVKQLIVAREGNVFVGADYSQLEPRVFSFYSKDKRLLAAFESSDDFYSVIGMEVFNKTDCLPIKDGHPDAFGIKYKKLRDLSKVIALASTYGATAAQLAKTTKKSIDDTAEDIATYFDHFPGVAQMMLDSHEEAKTTGQVKNLFGRLRRIPEAKEIPLIYGNKAHSELPYEARTVLNLAVNHVIQSTGASIVNRAAIKFHNNINSLGIKAKIACQVHDSLVIECPAEEAETVSLLLQDAMENTVTLEGINLEAIPKIGKNLSEV